MPAVHSDIRTSSWAELTDRIGEAEIGEALRITENEMLLGYGQNSLRAHGFKASSGSLTARLKSLKEEVGFCRSSCRDVPRLRYRHSPLSNPTAPERT